MDRPTQNGRDREKSLGLSIIETMNNFIKVNCEQNLEEKTKITENVRLILHLQPEKKSRFDLQNSALSQTKN